eukprot:768782-Hanusia_phi.AAC.1
MCFQTDVSWLFDPQPTSSAGPQLDDGPKPPAAGPDPSGLGNFAYEGSESPPPKAHIGFCIAYASCREQVLPPTRPPTYPIHPSIPSLCPPSLPPSLPPCRTLEPDPSSQLTRTLRALLPKDEEELKEWT